MIAPMILVCFVASFLAPQMPAKIVADQKQSALRIVVLAGEDSVNVIQQKTAVAPIIEVRDRNNLPVAGATVVFSVSGQGATFGAGSALTVVTNAAGQATAAGLTPVTAGAINISATATFQGQTATIAISQSNVLTAAAANAAGAGGTSAGGGIGIGKVIAIVGGIGAAGAGVAVAAGGSNSDSSTSTSTSTPTQSPIATTPTTPTGGTPTAPTPAPTTPTPPAPNSPPAIISASINPGYALVGANAAIAFQVQASDADNDTLTYLWEFPDGTTSDQPAFTRVFQHGGVYTIRVNVRDGKTSSSSEMTFHVKTMIGGWIEESLGPYAGHTFTLNQSGSSLFGTYRTNLAECPMTGSIRSGGAVTLQAPTCRYLFAPQGVWYELPPYRWEFEPSADGDNFIGTMYVEGCRDCVTPNWSGGVRMRRQR